MTGAVVIPSARSTRHRYVEVSALSRRELIVVPTAIAAVNARPVEPGNGNIGPDSEVRSSFASAQAAESLTVTLKGDSYD